MINRLIIVYKQRHRQHWNGWYLVVCFISRNEFQYWILQRSLRQVLFAAARTRLENCYLLWSWILGWAHLSNPRWNLSGLSRPSSLNWPFMRIETLLQPAKMELVCLNYKSFSMTARASEGITTGGTLSRFQIE